MFHNNVSKSVSQYVILTRYYINVLVRKVVSLFVDNIVFDTCWYFLTSSSRFRLQLQHHVVVRPLFGHPRVLRQLLLDGDADAGLGQQLLQLLERLRQKSDYQLIL